MIQERFRKNIGIIVLVFVVVIILVIYEIPRNKKSTLPAPSPTPAQQTKTFPLSQSVSPSNYKLPVYSQPPVDSSGQVNTNSVKVQSAISEKSKFRTYLPIYIDGFQAMSGLKTTLNVYTIPEDPDYLIHVEIYGINYGDPNILQPDNQNGQAFVASFKKIESILATKGVDLHNIYFVMGSKPYILNATDSLLRKYNLL